MKKIVTAITAALAAIILAVCFAACGANYVGTYKFNSMKMESPGMTMEYVVGENYGGITFNEDVCTVEIKEDGTWSMSMNLLGTSQDVTGTWTTNEEGNVVLTDDATGESQVAKLDGSTLVIEEDQSGMTMQITLKKK